MLLDNKGFNLWANDYDKDVNLSDEDNTYPFAGYKAILADIFAEIMNQQPCKILDIGIGTGVLATKLYEAGNLITGIDFSEEMLKISGIKMPNARLIEYDFAAGLPAEIQGEKFDFIILTYSIHHLTYRQQTKFLLQALEHLSEDGKIIIGDVAFETEEMMRKCAEDSADYWDEDEFYLIYAQLLEELGSFCKLDYQQDSHCSGILKITK